jgi:hypothetical protein
MSITYVHHKDINPQKWNAVIVQSPWPLVYGLYEYLNTVCDQQWDALIFNDYEAVFPLPYKKKFGFKYIVQPLFCQQLGAFGSSLNVKTLDFLIAIPKRFFRVRLQLNPYFDGQTNHGQFNHGGIKSIFTRVEITPKTNLTIRLIESLNYNKDCLKNLSRLSTHDIEYRTNHISIHTAIDIYKGAWGEQNPGIGQNEYNKLARACSSDHSFTVSAHSKIDGRVLGAAIFLKTPECSRCCIHYVCAGPTEIGKSIGVMHGIIDFVLKQYQGQNVLFDFEGSSIASVASFYKKFGASEEPFLYFKRGF